MLKTNKPLKFKRRDRALENVVVDKTNESITRLHPKLILDPVLEFEGKYYIICSYKDTQSKGVINQLLGKKIGEGKYALAEKKDVFIANELTIIYQLPTSVLIMSDNKPIEHIEFYCGLDLTLTAKIFNEKNERIELISKHPMRYGVESYPMFNFVARVITKSSFDTKIYNG